MSWHRLDVKVILAILFLECMRVAETLVNTKQLAEMFEFAVDLCNIV